MISDDKAPDFDAPLGQPKSGETQLTDFNNSFEQPTQPINKGNENMSGINSLVSLLSQVNLSASHNTVPEMDEIAKAIKERVKVLKSNTAAEAQKAALPADIQILTNNISPSLPGFAMYTIFGTECYVMPVLFYKAGITDVTDTVQFHNEAPRGFAKVPSSFMTGDLSTKVKQNFTTIGGKQMQTVSIVNPRVVNLERYLKAGLHGEDLVRVVAAGLLEDFVTGLMSLGSLLQVKAAGNLESPFGSRKLYGDHGAAMARVETATGLDATGLATPYNLTVKLATTGKNGQQFNNNQISKTIITTPLNVQLEAMSREQFAQARMARPGQSGVGPLVPIVSIGHSIPGETLGNNSSPLSIILGLYAALAANAAPALAEAYRNKEVGSRGNLSNFNSMMVQYLGPQAYDANCMLTDKNLSNIELVNNWIRNYVSTTPVYVVDAPAYLDNASTSEFYFGLAEKGSDSVYYKTAMIAANLLSNGKFLELANANKADNSRDKSKQWAPGDAILLQTGTLRPRGIATNPKTSKAFDLGEIDGMFLRQKEYFGENEIAVAEYQGLVQGSTHIQDARQRQFHITSRLMAMTNNTAIIEGWDMRFIVSPAFANTLRDAMVNAGTLTVSANNYGGQYVASIENTLLSNMMTAGIQAAGANASYGGSPMFTVF